MVRKRETASQLPTKRARAEEAPDETLTRILLDHKALAYGPANPVRCQCGQILAPAGHILHRDEFHVKHIIEVLKAEGMTWRN